jgi:hypothetical protein
VRRGRGPRNKQGRREGATMSAFDHETAGFCKINERERRRTVEDSTGSSDNDVGTLGQLLHVLSDVDTTDAGVALCGTSERNVQLSL